MPTKASQEEVCRKNDTGRGTPSTETHRLEQICHVRQIFFTLPSVLLWAGYSWLLGVSLCIVGGLAADAHQMPVVPHSSAAVTTHMSPDIAWVGNISHG